MTTEELLKLLGGFTDKYGPMISAAGGAAITEKGISDVKDLQAGLMQGLTGSSTFQGAFPQGLLNTIQQGMQFKPFTVTSGTGATAAAGPSGLSLGLSPQEQAIQSQLMGLSQELAGGIGYGRQNMLMDLLAGSPQEMQAREADVYGRLQAMQAPEQERARLALENRLASQGRLGVKTSMFGGTPEALALEKAIAEQNARSAVDAMGIARQEQAQTSGQRLQALQQQLGEQGLMAQAIPSFLQSAYIPQTGMLNALQPGVELARQQSALQAGIGDIMQSLGTAGLSTQAQLQGQTSALRQQQLQGLLQSLLGPQQTASTTGGTVNVGGQPSTGFNLDWLNNLF